MPDQIDSLPVNILYNKTLFKLKGFIKTKFLGVKDPLYEKLSSLSAIKLGIKTNSFSRKFMTGNDSLSPFFGKKLLFIYQYIKPLREEVVWTSLFKADEFPLFVINFFSNPKQQEWLKILLSPQEMQLLIEQEGIKKSKVLIKNTFDQFKESFTYYQIYNINRVISIGIGFFTFLSFNFTGLLKLFYSDYNSNELQSMNKAQSVSFSAASLLLDEFLNHISVINTESNYYEFIELYGLFLGKKIIAQKDFELLINTLKNFVENNTILNIVQVIKQDDLVRPNIPSRTYETIKVNDIMKSISQKIQKNHYNVITHVRVKNLDLILEELFERAIIEKILGFQSIINSYITKDEKKRTYSSLLVVIAAFKDKIFDVNVKKTFNYLLEHAVFLIEEFKQDLLSSYQEIMSCLDLSKKMLQEYNRAYNSKKETPLEQDLLDKLERKACKIVAQFIHNSFLFSSFLQTIIDNGHLDLNSKIKLNLSKENLTKLIVNFKVATTVYQNLEEYLKIGIASIDQLSKNNV